MSKLADIDESGNVLCTYTDSEKEDGLKIVSAHPRSSLPDAFTNPGSRHPPASPYLHVYMR